jgi:ATP-dependent protease ClpP protease subunit
MARRPKQVRKYKLDHRLTVPVSDLTASIHEYDLDLKSNHIYLMNREISLYGAGSVEEPGVDHLLASRFIRNINLCMRVNPKKPIVIHKNICGGFWEQGMAVYDAIKSCPTPVTILNYTHSRSMSSIIMQAANKRVMMPNSHFMYHEGSLDISGTNKGVKSYIKFSKTFDSVSLEIYSKIMKESSAKWKDKPLVKIKRYLQDKMDKEEDVFLNAHQTVEEGLADEVFNYDWSGLIKYTDVQLTR